MGDDPAPSVIAAEPTDVRFSLRAILMVTVAVAIAAAVLGPYFRGLDPGKRAPVAALWGVCWIIVLSWVGHRARTRIRLERLAGRTLVALPPRGKLVVRAMPLLTIVGGGLWICFGLFYLVMAAEDFDRPTGTQSPEFAAILFRGLVSAFVITTGIVAIWWNQKVQLRERGVLRGLRLLNWTHVTGSYWRGRGLYLEGVDQDHTDTRLAMNVPPDQRANVEALLLEKLPSRTRHAVGTLSPAETPIVLPKIHIRPWQEREIRVRHVLVIVAMYIAIIVAVAYRPWGQTPREFNRGALVGLGIATAVSIYRWRLVGNGGAPLVRLSQRIDWTRLSASLLLVVGFYYIHQQVAFFSTIVSGILGAACGLCAGAFVVIILPDEFDLCENGVVIVRWTFWPWDRVRLSKWNRHGNGALVLCSGWRRVLTKVPSARREAVDAVLREKLSVQATTSNRDS